MYNGVPSCRDNVAIIICEDDGGDGVVMRLESS